MRKIQDKFIFIVVTILLSTACQPKLPQGWRFPTNEELKHTWRNESNNRYALLEEDFNDDGIIDKAALLMRDDGTGLGLFVFFGQAVVKLDEVNDSKLIECIGIRNINYGPYKTVCGKGYINCAEDEPSEIIIASKTIDYFKIEGANSFFYLDIASNYFKRIWISD